MISTMFISIGLHISGLLFLTMIAIVYLIKKKFKTYSNKSFIGLLITTFIIILLEILAYFGANGVKVLCDIKETLIRFYAMGALTYASFFMAYYLSVYKITDLNENKSKQNKLTIIFTLYIIIGFIASFFLNINLEGGNEHLKWYVIDGSILYVLLSAVVIGLSVFGYSIFTSYKKITYSEKILLGCIIGSFVFMTIIQKVFDFNIADISYILVIIVACTYLIIENQDKQAIIELKNEERNINIESDKAITKIFNETDVIASDLSSIMIDSEIILNTKNIDESIIDNIYNKSLELLQAVSNNKDIELDKTGGDEK